MSSPYRLSRTHPARGCQKGTPLAIDTPHLTMLRYIVRAALDSGSWIHPVTRVVPSVAVGTTFTSDFVSHGPHALQGTGDLLRRPLPLQQGEYHAPRHALRVQLGTRARSLASARAERLRRRRRIAHGRTRVSGQLAAHS